MPKAKIAMGTLRSDGYRFTHCGPGGKENWYSPPAYHRVRVNFTKAQARTRAKAKGLPFDLDNDYLISIFPADGKCPALGIDLSWGLEEGRDNSPALDRIAP